MTKIKELNKPNIVSYLPSKNLPQTNEEENKLNVKTYDERENVLLTTAPSHATFLVDAVRTAVDMIQKKAFQRTARLASAPVMNRMTK